MNAPLSLFLTHFTAPPPEPIPAPVALPFEFVDQPPEPEPEPELEPQVTLAVADLEARLEAAVETARSEADQRHEAETAALVEAHEAALVEAVMSARATWIDSESGALTSRIDTAMVELRTALSDGIAAVLRPMLATALLARTKTELLDAIDRLLADPTQPVLTVRAPEDLGAALRAARPAAGIEWIVADTVEVAIVADATRIETSLAAALADIAKEI
jgi:hypothetical protein